MKSNFGISFIFMSLLLSMAMARECCVSKTQSGSEYSMVRDENTCPVGADICVTTQYFNSGGNSHTVTRSCSYECPTGLGYDVYCCNFDGCNCPGANGNMLRTTLMSTMAMVSFFTLISH